MRMADTWAEVRAMTCAELNARICDVVKPATCCVSKLLTCAEVRPPIWAALHNVILSVDSACSCAEESPTKSAVSSATI